MNKIRRGEPVGRDEIKRLKQDLLGSKHEGWGDEEVNGPLILIPSECKNPIARCETEMMFNVFDVFPCVIPPFKAFTLVDRHIVIFIRRISIEDTAFRAFALPSKVHLKQHEDRFYDDDKDPDWRENENLIIRWAEACKLPNKVPGDEIYPFEPQKWLIEGLVFLFDAQGSYVLADNFAYTTTERGGATSSMYRSFDRPFPYLFTGIAFQTLSLLHCKNVILQDENPAQLDRKDRKTRSITGLKYKVLTVDPTRSITRRSGADKPNQHSAPFHICRGHFKDYSGKGLFGRYKGLYWWESCVRGTGANGEVIKDYRLVTP